MVKWDDYKIDWYVDDTLKRRLTRYYNIIGQNVDCDGVHANNPYILEKTFPEDSMTIIVNLAIQSGDYAPDSSTVFPAAMEIDYIRYYAQLPFSGAENDPDFQADGALPFKLYPNPCSKVLTLEPGDKSLTAYEIRLTDELGNIVLINVQKGKSTFKLDVSALKRGLYFIQIHDQKTRQEYSGTVILY